MVVLLLLKRVLSLYDYCESTSCSIACVDGILVATVGPLHACT